MSPEDEHPVKRRKLESLVKQKSLTDTGTLASSPESRRSLTKLVGGERTLKVALTLALNGIKKFLYRIFHRNKNLITAGVGKALTMPSYRRFNDEFEPSNGRKDRIISGSYYWSFRPLIVSPNFRSQPWGNLKLKYPASTHLNELKRSLNVIDDKGILGSCILTGIIKQFISWKPLLKVPSAARLQSTKRLHTGFHVGTLTTNDPRLILASQFKNFHLDINRSNIDSESHLSYCLQSINLYSLRCVLLTNSANSSIPDPMAGPVVFNDEVLEAGVNRGRLSLVGRLLSSENPSRVRVQHTANILWAKRAPVTVLDTRFSLFQFIFANADDRDEALEKVSWFIQTKIFTMREWEKPTEHLYLDLARVPYLVQLWDLPEEYRTFALGNLLASRLGSVTEAGMYTVWESPGCVFKAKVKTIVISVNMEIASIIPLLHKFYTLELRS